MRKLRRGPDHTVMARRSVIVSGLLQSAGPTVVPQNHDTHLFFFKIKGLWSDYAFSSRMPLITLCI